MNEQEIAQKALDGEISTPVAGRMFGTKTIHGTVHRIFSLEKQRRAQLKKDNTQEHESTT